MVLTVTWVKVVINFMSARMPAPGEAALREIYVRGRYLGPLTCQNRWTSAVGETNDIRRLHD